MIVLLGGGPTAKMGGNLWFHTCGEHFAIISRIWFRLEFGVHNDGTWLTQCIFA